MSDTPRTDAAIVPVWDNMRAVPPNFARQLETELAAARAEVEALRSDVENWGDALNVAGWEFMEAHLEIMGPMERKHIFNQVKPILRRAIQKYIQVAIDAAREGKK